LTDTAVPGPVPDVPQPQPDDIPFLLATISQALARPLERADVLGAFAGLRPLIDGAAGARTADLSRRHAIVRGEGGVVSVVGGKLTTYRRTAQHALDVAVREAGLSAAPCRTRSLPLVGAAPRQALAAIPAPARLVDRHGAEAPAVLALAQGDPALLAPVAPGLDVLLVEVLHAMRAEGALDAADVLDRRTRIGLVPADRARAAGPVEELLAAAPRAAAA
jgi:glycerol-3-phosphate dehydrogenase